MRGVPGGGHGCGGMRRTSRRRGLMLLLGGGVGKYRERDFSWAARGGRSGADEEGRWTGLKVDFPEKNSHRRLPSPDQVARSLVTNVRLPLWPAPPLAPTQLLPPPQPQRATLRTSRLTPLPPPPLPNPLPIPPPTFPGGAAILGFRHRRRAWSGPGTRRRAGAGAAAGAAEAGNGASTRSSRRTTSCTRRSGRASAPSSTARYAGRSARSSPSSSFSSKPQINIHNRDKGNGGALQVADEPSPEAVPKALKSPVPNVDEHDDRSKPPLMQQRGRFKVTPGHVELDKAHPPGLQKCRSMQGMSHLPALSIPSSAEAASTIIGGSFYIQLYNVLQTNMLQTEQILQAMKQLHGSDFASPVCTLSRAASPSSALSVDRSMLEAAQEKEKELLNEVLELQWRLLCSQDEVQRLEAKAAQI